MKLRLLALILAMCLLLAMPVHAAQDEPFHDLEEDAWYLDAVFRVVEEGLLSGTHPGRFSPEAATTRAMLWVILWRLEGVEAKGQSPWYEDARQWAMEAGITDGSDPESVLTREQFATILYRYAGYKGLNTETAADTLILSYVDAETVSTFAVSALQWACGQGIITGKPGDLLDPAGSAKRCEAAAILIRFLDQIG